MHSLTTVHITAASITLLAITFLGLRAGKSVRNASDFSDGGRSASALLVKAQPRLVSSRGQRISPYKKLLAFVSSSAMTDR